MEDNLITEKIIGLAYQVHTLLGPGLLESAYEECLHYEMVNGNLYVEKQKPIPLIYKDIKLEYGYRADLLVENKIIVEIKSIESIHDIHVAQILTYMKLAKCHIGLLINFNVKSLKEGIRRFIL